MLNPTENPWRLFDEWYALARPLGEQTADAMALATATPNGRPSVRTVLFRGIVRDGVAFYTNYESRKGLELAANPWAALNFYWQSLGRQVRIEGSVSRLTRAESEAYFNGRPKESQISAWASPQSCVIGSREELEARVSKVGERFKSGGTVPCPEFWGGFHVEPTAFEFWLEGSGRLHQRVRYERHNGAWTRALLGP